MKKALSLLLALACLLSLTVIAPATASAEEVNLDSLFESNLSFLDQYYTLDAEYMLRTVCGELYPWDKAEQLNYAHYPVSAATFEATLNTYFAPTQQDMADIRGYVTGRWVDGQYVPIPFYDEATDTYQVFYIGGFGGALPSRKYIGYTASDVGYAVYYAGIHYLHLPESEYAKVEELGWPETYTYEGNVYENGPDGYVYISSLATEGNLYQVSVNKDNTLRIHSQTPYTESQLPPHLGRVQVEVQPKTVYAKAGAKVTTKVTAVGYGLTYAWYLKNAGATKYSKSSVTANQYTTTMNDKAADRLVYCVITDAYGNSVKTETVALRQQLAITTQPKTTYTKLNATAKVTVKAAGDGLKYAWYVKNAGAAKYSKSSVTAATYSVKMTDKVKDRRVYCVVTDKYGKKVQSDTVLLRQAASITTQPKTTYTKLNATAKVTVKAAGDGLKYAWYVKNAGAAKYSKSSVTAATYSVKMTAKVKDRRVYCVVTDKYGKKVQSNTVILRQAATVTTQPKSVKVANGKTAKVTVKAVGDGLKYTWYVKNAGATKYTRSSVTSSTYSIKMSKSVNDRRVYCVVTDKYGNTVRTETVKLSMKTSSTVWVSGSGTKYHTSSACSNMKSPRQMTKKDAEQAGYTPCSKCF